MLVTQHSGWFTGDKTLACGHWHLVGRLQTVRANRTARLLTYGENSVASTYMSNQIPVDSLGRVRLPHPISITVACPAYGSQRK